ncbi:MAG: universal stress protein [Dehalococcoidia bacterium]|nr:universal stress protein [Dehalococcoidia bacterium]
MFKILVATDGSEYARKAAEYAGQLASKIPDAEITILSVLDIGLISQAAVSPSGMPVTIPVALSEDMERALNSVLQDARDKLAPTGRPVTTRLEEGRPAQVICDIAEKERFDMIVMGSSGQGRIADILLGSVSDKVVHKAKTPVVIVRSKESHEGRHP